MPLSTSQAFRRAAERLVRAMEGAAADSPDELIEWSIESGHGGVCYLVHPTIFHPSKHAPTDRKQCQDDDSVICGTWIDETVNSDPDVAGHPHDDTGAAETEWIFHTVYNETWRAPVLFFHVQYRDGTACSRKVVLDRLSIQGHYPNQSGDSWDFCSQEEHPGTGLPAFFLHPCRTQERLDAMQASTNDEAVRLLSWMCMILPSVGYPISSRTFLKLKEKLKEIN
jgi:hypothetical protein